jgi:DNA-binding transcriptional ArsR family regulator
VSPTSKPDHLHLDFVANPNIDPATISTLATGDWVWSGGTGFGRRPRLTVCEAGLMSAHRSDRHLLAGGAVQAVCHNLRVNADMREADLAVPSQADNQSVELAVEVFMMLADATRVRIVLALKDGELSVNALAGVVEKSPAAVSQHLAKLRLGRIVTTRHEGTRVYYRLEDEHAQQLVTDAIHQAEHSIGGRPRHHSRPREDS